MRQRKPAKAKMKARGQARVTVDNPFFSAAHPVDATNPKHVQVVKNTRESAIETLFARGQLGTAQKKAADQFRALWEAAGGNVKSLDYTSDRVDGGRGDPVVGRLHAAKELERCRSLIGFRGYQTIEAVCGEGRALGEISPIKRSRLTMADNLRADLDDLAGMWGLQTRRGIAS